MAWYDETSFYHIYPLGLTGAPKKNEYGEPVHRLNTLIPWISHIKELGCGGIYIGPLFESVGHGYETTDYKKVDSRLGTNEDLTNFVKECHEQGIKVVLDGVFNHTGRDFFAFQDIKKNRENSRYLHWYCNVNFWGNTEYNDGFSYENWGGYNLLVKLNQRNPEVQNFICDVIRFWVEEFDIDGIRLDAADVLDFEFMKVLRQTTNQVKEDFWLMGEVIHGDYTRWVNGSTLHAVTNYTLHKALYSGHNDHNYFEIAHTVKRLWDMAGGNIFGLRLYNFADNHDVERIYTKLSNKAHMVPVHVLMYTLPGVPAIYYGSEFGIEGRKVRGNDDILRPCLDLNHIPAPEAAKGFVSVIKALGKARKECKALSYGSYKELMLTTTQYAFERSIEGETAVVTVNNSDQDATMNFGTSGYGKYIGALSGTVMSVENGRVSVTVKANSGEVWLPLNDATGTYEPVEYKVPVKEEPVVEAQVGKAGVVGTVVAGTSGAGTSGASVAGAGVTGVSVAGASVTGASMAGAGTGSFGGNAEGNGIPQQIRTGIPYEEMTIEELQFCIIEKMRKNGPVTDQMRRTVVENTHHGSLMNWVRSFR